MELEPDQRPTAMPNGHDHAVGGAGRNEQTRRQRGLVHDQRVIAAGDQRIRHSRKHALFVVKHVADAAMHRFGSPHDPGPQGRGDGLMSQTDAQQGNRPGKPPHHVQRAPSFARRAGPRR